MKFLGSSSISIDQILTELILLHGHGNKDEYEYLGDIIEDPLHKINQDKQDKARSLNPNGKHNGSERRSLSLNQGAEALPNAIRHISNQKLRNSL